MEIVTLLINYFITGYFASQNMYKYQASYYTDLEWIDEWIFS